MFYALRDCSAFQGIVSRFHSCIHSCNMYLQQIWSSIAFCPTRHKHADFLIGADTCPVFILFSLHFHSISMLLFHKLNFFKYSKTSVATFNRLKVKLKMFAGKISGRTGTDVSRRQWQDRAQLHVSHIKLKTQLSVPKLWHFKLFSLGMKM